MADTSNLNGKEYKDTAASSVIDKEIANECSGDTITRDSSDQKLEEKIIRQIEYYFGDINLPRDKFLQEQIKIKNGWVTLDILLTFKRLASLTTDKAIIVSALRKSPKKLMEISEDESEIRRDPLQPLPEMNEERRKELRTRTLYFKGFPLETTLDDVLEFFNKMTPVENVVMRSYKDKATNTLKFKGSVFVVFPTREAADSILKQESVTFEDNELKKVWQNDYIEDKRKERLVAKSRKNTSKNDGEEVEEYDRFPKNAVIHLSGCPPDLTREVIKSKMEELNAAVAFVDFNKGDSAGWVRLQDEGKALEVLEILKNGKLKVNEHSIDIRALVGEEETKFLEKVKADIAKKRNNSNKGRRGRRGGYGSGGSYDRKRKGSPISDSATPAKSALADC